MSTTTFFLFWIYKVQTCISQKSWHEFAKFNRCLLYLSAYSIFRSNGSILKDTVSVCLVKIEFSKEYNLGSQFDIIFNSILIIGVTYY